MGLAPTSSGTNDVPGWRGGIVMNRPRPIVSDPHERAQRWAGIANAQALLDQGGTPWLANLAQRLFWQDVTLWAASTQVDAMRASLQGWVLTRLHEGWLTNDRTQVRMAHDLLRGRSNRRFSRDERDLARRLRRLTSQGEKMDANVLAWDTWRTLLFSPAQQTWDVRSYNVETTSSPDRPERDLVLEQRWREQAQALMWATGLSNVGMPDHFTSAERLEWVSKLDRSFRTLSILLDWPLAAMGLNGIRVRIARLRFDCAGCYAREERLIELTSSNDGHGDVLAHEWFHALDHALAQRTAWSPWLLSYALDSARTSGLRPSWWRRVLWPRKGNALPALRAFWEGLNTVPALSDERPNLGSLVVLQRLTSRKLWWARLPPYQQDHVLRTWSLLGSTVERGRFPEERRAALRTMAMVLIGSMPMKERPSPESIEAQLAEAMVRENDLVASGKTWTFLALARYSEQRTRTLRWSYFSRPSEVLARCFEVWVRSRVETLGIAPDVLVRGTLAQPGCAFAPRGEAVTVLLERMDCLLRELRHALLARERRGDAGSLPIIPGEDNSG